jgi:hypothetical protein
MTPCCIHNDINSPHLDARPVSASGRKRTPAAEAPPTLVAARKRLAAARFRSQPWLTPTVLEARADLPEVIGPETYRKV